MCCKCIKTTSRLGGELGDKVTQRPTLQGLGSEARA